jgi:F-type H+-transporting ATPase subunit delta
MAVVSSRYARAFADVVTEKKLDAAATMQQLQTLLALVSDSEELRRVWENPAIPAEQKRNLLDAIVARSGISRPVRNFVAILIDHHRVDELAEITRHFELDIYERLGFVEAQISSARELSEAEKRDLEVQIAKMTGKRVRAKYGINSQLLGGAVVRIGSTIYDGSVHGQLEKMREQLST